MFLKPLMSFQRTFEPLDSDVPILDVLAGQADEFGDTQPMPEAYLEHQSLPKRQLSIQQYDAELFSGKMLHIVLTL